MQQRAGLLFLSVTTGRFFLILEESKWTVPTFTRSGPLLEDAKFLLERYAWGKILPIELYLSEDRGFEYGTYVCILDKEFICQGQETFCWAALNNLPKQLHNGLKATLNNAIIKTKLETILELTNVTNT